MDITCKNNPPCRLGYPQNNTQALVVWYQNIYVQIESVGTPQPTNAWLNMFPAMYFFRSSLGAHKCVFTH